MKISAKLFLALAILALTSAARADEPLPNYVQIGVLGQIDPATGCLRSFDSGSQKVPVQPLFPEWFYEFIFDASLGSRLNYFIDTSTGYNATIELQDASHNNIGPLAGSALTKSGTYYIHVSAGATTRFHFAIIATPQLTLYPDDAGHSEAQALNLGTLMTTISHKNSFYTYFSREDPQYTTSPASGPLVVDFDKPIPYAPSLDWYQFSLAIPGAVTLQDNGANPGPTYVLVHPDGTRGIWNNNTSVFLQAGTYFLIVADRVTQVPGGTVFIRNGRLEDFEHYLFALNLSTGGQPGQPTAVDLTTTLIDVNTNLGIGHSTTTKPGGPVIVTYKVNNLGYPSSSAGNIGFYLSRTPTFAADAVFLVRANLFSAVPANGSTQNITGTIQLPTPLASGAYYVIVVADYDHGVAETNYNNNASVGMPITVTEN